MRKFTDEKGNLWSIRISIGSAMKLKESLGIDILQPEQGDPPLLTRLGTDAYLLAQTIACLLEDQFEQNDVSETNVYDLFGGETLIRAQTAFYEEMTDFFQKSGRVDRAKAVEKQGESINAAVQAAEAVIGGFDVNPVIENAIRETITGK